MVQSIFEGEVVCRLFATFFSFLIPEREFGDITTGTQSPSSTFDDYDIG
jgi:hypothetical protein